MTVRKKSGNDVIRRCSAAEGRHGGENRIKRAVTGVFALLMAVLVITFMLAPATQLRAETFKTIGGYDIRVIDNADLFTEDEELQLFNRMSGLAKYGNIILLTESTVNTSNTGAYAKQWYNSRYGRASGTVFLIDMQNRYLYIFSNGRNYQVITDSAADNITDNVYRYAKNGDYFK